MKKVTIRQEYINILTELVKEESPVLYLEDFLYYYNKGLNEYINLRYEKFELTQQLSDDLRAWKTTYNTDSLIININDLGKSPEDTSTKCSAEAVDVCNGKCAEESSTKDCSAMCKDIADNTEITQEDIAQCSCEHTCDEDCSGGDDCIPECMVICEQDCERAIKKAAEDKCIENNFTKCKESYTADCIKKSKKPYRHLLSCSITVALLRPVSHCDQKLGTVKTYKVTRSTSDRNAVLSENVYLNARFYRPYYSISGDIITIDVGDIDKKKAKISNITIDYLMQPNEVDLTESEITTEMDTSQVLEFTADVANEVRKRVMLLILERHRDIRMQSNLQVNQSIGDIGAMTAGGGKK